MDKKTEILKAAGNCFARYGYEKTTMDDIGKLIGLNKASIYYYYKNKESIFTEVILYEANEFLTAVLEKVSGVKGCKDKIITYLVEWLRYIRKAINLHSLTLERVQGLCPLFNHLYEKIMEKETEALSGILQCCVSNGEIIECDVKRVARSIITVKEGIKNRPSNFENCSFASEVDYSSVESEIVFTISLILDGLRKKI
ncbi:MAG: TetR/AcrR family transcriptional regulator [Clostridia bacterium]|nr:TetR/AcrR family transcriptional regulator [Clostridia bacterium]